MAALNYFYGIPKYPLPRKLFGVFTHRKEQTADPDPLMRGISDEFHVCHSRHSTVRESDLRKEPRLKVLAASHRRAPRDRLQHSIIPKCSSSDTWNTTATRWKRNTSATSRRGCPSKSPSTTSTMRGGIKMNWSSTANLFYNNWLNFVYQTTPYRFD